MVSATEDVLPFVTRTARHYGIFEGGVRFSYLCW